MTLPAAALCGVSSPLTQKPVLESFLQGGSEDTLFVFEPIQQAPGHGHEALPAPGSSEVAHAHHNLPLPKPEPQGRHRRPDPRPWAEGAIVGADGNRRHGARD